MTSPQIPADPAAPPRRRTRRDSQPAPALRHLPDHPGPAAARRARAGDPESGALSLEWIVIAGILVVAAVAAGAFFTSQISTWEHKIP